MFYDEVRFVEARVALVKAHKAVEALRGETTREEGRKRLAKENAEIYARLVFCCLHQGDTEMAFEYAAAAKGRAFIDILSSTRVDLLAAGVDDPELATELSQARKLRASIDALITRLLESDNGQAADQRSQKQLNRDLNSLRREEKVLWYRLASRHPVFSATLAAPSLTAREATALAADLGATLVEYYRHAEGWTAFVIDQFGVRHIDLPQVGDHLLVEAGYWLERIHELYFRNELSYTFLRRLHEALLAPLAPHLPVGGRVMLAPFSWLHLLPLASAVIGESGQSVGQRYNLAFIPSLGALKVVWAQVRLDQSDDDRSLNRLLSVAYPGQPDTDRYLRYVVDEAEAIAAYFSQVTSLHQDAATPDGALREAPGHDIVHFGCHSVAGFEQSLPGLLLKGGVLEIERILLELHLAGTRLITLAACSSGRISGDAGDNLSGLVQSMLIARGQAVVASLWPIDDHSTRWLFEHFYARLAAGASPARALQGARAALQGTSSWRHPYYWAAFQAYGLAYNEAGIELGEKPAYTMFSDIQERAGVVQRGGRQMELDDSVRGAVIFLEQMQFYNEEILETLDEEEVSLLTAALPYLADQAGTVENEAGLLTLVNAIHILVEELPGLRHLLIPKEVNVAAARAARTISPEEGARTDKKDEAAKEMSKGISNEIDEYYKQLNKAVPEPSPADLGLLARLLSMMGLGRDQD